ncbi:hypothetical protein PF002_g14332 [Phytophthora fragariae]|uniref:Uncharacterized protein n=1 Tax=Phytophthora fragariae TaxID=53985 RepID=A0A6A3YX61_9STRA|nr:hypothetical protein PF002_g14332 [Phytophthora fragariae]
MMAARTHICELASTFAMPFLSVQTLEARPPFQPQDLNKLWIKPSCRRIARATDSEPNVIYLWWYYIKEAEVAMVDTAGR